MIFTSPLVMKRYATATAHALECHFSDNCDLLSSNRAYIVEGALISNYSATTVLHRI